MKYIAKNPEPQEFLDWKASIQDDFERKLAQGASGSVLWEILPTNFPRPETDVNEAVLYAKSQLRQALLEEQGFICCYCNRALKNNHTTLNEHFKPKGIPAYRNLIFVYENLMACCDGGERDKSKEIYCTLLKNSNDPTFPIAIISPLDENCEILFKFDEQGRIHPHNNDPRAIETIKFLGLDVTDLNLNRKKAIETYIYEIWTEDMDTAAELERLSSKINGKYEPFCMAIIDVLKNYP